MPLSGSPLAAQTGEGLLRLTRRSGPSDSDVIYVRCMRPERDGTGTRGSGVELRHCYAPRFPSHIGRAVHIMAQMMRCERGPDMQLRWATGHNSVATPSGHASNDRVQIERAVVSERPGACKGSKKKAPILAALRDRREVGAEARGPSQYPYLLARLPELGPPSCTTSKSWRPCPECRAAYV